MARTVIINFVGGVPLIIDAEDTVAVQVAEDFDAVLKDISGADPVGHVVVGPGHVLRWAWRWVTRIEIVPIVEEEVLG